MAKTIIKNSSVKASTGKRSGKPPPGDKNLGPEPATRFYVIEDGDDTKKGEGEEILAIHD